jgi:AAA15 family ATPase/GTPase
MFWQFTVKNYKTFKDEATLSLVASNYDKKTLEAENIYSDEVFNKRILKSAVVYGANASGKSTLVNAIAFMRFFVLRSAGRQQGDSIEVDPFRLNVTTENEPSEFEVIFSFDHILYRYGFEATQEEVISEWLYYKPKTKEVELFYRDGDQIDFHESLFSKGKMVATQGLVRKNALLVSVAAQFNEEQAIAVINWFRNLRVISNVREYFSQRFTINRTKTPADKQKIITLLKDADFGIQDIEVELMNEDNIPSHYPPSLRNKSIAEIKEGNMERVKDILFSHRKYGRDNEFVHNVPFSLDKDESSGTQKYFNLLGPILDVLENGQVLIVDELDAQLHPNLLCRIISLFHSTEMNHNNAQLIFNTHDTNLLDSGLFRRDQIWFTDKDKYGAAKLYSLADFSSEEVRKNEAFEKNYIKGKYGAVPYFGSMDILNEIFSPYENEKQNNRTGSSPEKTQGAS